MSVPVASVPHAKRTSLLSRIFGIGKQKQAIYISPITGVVTPSLAPISDEKGQQKFTYTSPITEMLSRPPSRLQASQPTIENSKKKKGRKPVFYISPIQTMLESPPPQTNQFSPQSAPFGRTTSSPSSLTIPSVSPGYPSFPACFASGYCTGQETSGGSESNSSYSSEDSEVDTPTSFHLDPVSSSYIYQTQDNVGTMVSYQHTISTYPTNDTTMAATTAQAAAYQRDHPARAYSDGEMLVYMQASYGHVETSRNDRVNISGDNVINIGGAL